VPVRLAYWFGEPLTPPPEALDAARPEELAGFADQVAVATQALLDRALGEPRAVSRVKRSA
jgi:hypothetical protein